MKKQRIIDSVMLPLLEVTVGILSCVPLPVLRAAGSGLGWCLYHIARRRRQIAIANLGTVYGDSLSAREKRRIARRASAAFFQDMLVLMRGYRLPLDKLERVVDGREVATIKELVAEGHGAIIVSGHLSNFPLVVSYLARHGIPVATFVRKSGFRPTAQIIEKMQAATGVVSLDRARGAIEARSWLKRGGVLWLTIDQNARHGVLVDFFGKPATTYPLAVRLARAAGAPILPLFVHMDSMGTYVLEVEKPLRLPHSRPRPDEVVTELRQLTELLEQHILKTPEQWLWPHRRWRTADKMLQPTDACSNPAAPTS